MANNLISETSPYLLQHAQNPVNWYAWGKSALDKAKEENKLILISIGYSACHWCHVMEHESFENEEIAKLMNERFVCIKIDREERPDIDQLYMIAVQLMTGHGGWPLNCFTLPDQRPIYGGTYFNPIDWKNLLLNLADFYQQKPDEAEKFAVKLAEGMKVDEMPFKIKSEKNISKDDIVKMFSNLKTKFDYIEGGYMHAPKFPLPNNFLFTLRYAHYFDDPAAEAITKITLDKMAYGGIFDQIGGGFARYAVDDKWLIPHFEKMLYDNAQLISLYSEAFKKYGNPLYKSIVYQCINFISTELMDSSGGFYSALNADSEGVEGKFYTWQYSEFADLEKNEIEFLENYFNISKNGNWEHTNILHRENTDTIIAKSLNISIEELDKILSNIKSKLVYIRDKRVKPSLDDKILTAWNSLMISALSQAFKTFSIIEFKNMAVKSAEFFYNKLANSNSLRRDYKEGSSLIPAFSDDYAFLILAFIDVYEISYDEKYILKANELIQILLKNFYNPDSGTFFFTSTESEKLIIRKAEMTDNVIPASNSAIAECLYRLHELMLNSEYKLIADQLINNRSDLMKKHLSGHSNYALQAFKFPFPQYQVAITGPDSYVLAEQLSSKYLPNCSIAVAKTESMLPIFANRITNENLIYICENNSCKFPVKSLEEAIKLITG